MKPLYEYQQTDMSELVGTTFAKLLMISDELFLSEAQPKFAELFVYKMAHKRCEGLIGKDCVDPKLLAFLAVLTDRPGVVSLYVHAFYMMYYAERATITLDHIPKYFPDGLPSEATLKEAWEAQKVEGGANEVDLAKTYKAAPDCAGQHV